MPPEIALIRWTEKNTASTPDQNDLDIPHEVDHALSEAPEEHPEPLPRTTPEYTAEPPSHPRVDDRPLNETPGLTLDHTTERHTDDPLAELRSLHPHLLTPEQKELLWSESATPEPCRHHLGEPAEPCGSTPSRLYQRGRRCFTHAPDPIAAPGTWTPRSVTGPDQPFPSTHEEV
ncbi:hypothetical protein ACFV4I_16715 [Nocardiopsis alba]|uniref:hypothetical protein n=1 Tax=Nocardiopsis alba TaxID=53437 RepID=UPI00365B916F